jgi:hypothetical protein
VVTSRYSVLADTIMVINTVFLDIMTANPSQYFKLEAINGDNPKFVA